MNKKILLALSVSFAFVMLAGLSSAQSQCILTTTLINQDPYPAVPGELLKVVFQVSGLANPNCGDLVFEIVEDYPFNADPGNSPRKVVPAGTYSQDFSSTTILSYNLRVASDALDKETPLKVRYALGSETFIEKEFNVTVKEVKTDFEISVRDYDSATQIITFDILNIGKNDVEAVTVEMPSQENFDVKGSSRSIVGSLDSNDDTTFSFEGVPKAGDISLRILYTDETNDRRIVEETVSFNPGQFEGRVRDQKSYTWPIIILVVIVLAIVFFWYRRRKKKKRMHQLRD